MSTLLVNNINEVTPGNGVLVDGVTVRDGGIFDNASIFNVKNYGALGDGVTDDTAAIQATLTAAAAGGRVLFPPGTYILVGPVNVLNSGISIEGAGPGATTLKAQAGNENIAMLVVGDGINTCAHTQISGILFTAANQKTANQAIKLQKCFKTWIWNVRIELQYNGLYALDSTETFFRDSDIRDTANHGVIWESALGSGYDFYINNVVADNPNTVNAGNGIDWLGGENFVIQNCDFLNFNVGFNIHPAAAHQCRFGFFVNAEFDFAKDNCIKISGVDGGDVVGLSFTNTWTGTATNYGVLIAQDGGGGLLQGFRFTAHKSMHNGLAGFRLDGGQDIHMVGCDIIGNSQTNPNTRSGVEVSTNMGDNWSMVGCKSGNGYQQGNTQNHGLNVDGGHTYVGVMVTGCDFSQNTSDGIELNGATIQSGKLFANNGYLPNDIFENGTPQLWLRNTAAGHISKILDDGNLHIEGEGQNVWINGASNANILLVMGGGRVGIGVGSPGSPLSIANLPTSAAGLSSGDVYRTGPALQIVP